MKIPLLVIGGGLSGLAAAIRAARFVPGVVLLEKHSRLGGLNSYFYRNKNLYETGLHAVTNYAAGSDKKAPLNRLLRQLKLKREALSICQQNKSTILFNGVQSLIFSNDFSVLSSEIERKFPHCRNNFHRMVSFIDDFDPFHPAPFRSARRFLQDNLGDSLLADMISCPLMYYGSSMEDDMDLSQFVIMFQAIFREGMFRPAGTVKDLLDLLSSHYENFGGKIRTGCGVREIVFDGNRAAGALLDSGEYLECDHILSTIGLDETRRLCNREDRIDAGAKRIGFVETIFTVETSGLEARLPDTTIIFYNQGREFRYRIPATHTDLQSGVICFPANFQTITAGDRIEIRSTHLASYAMWRASSQSADEYEEQKKTARSASRDLLEQIVGPFASNIVYENTFTPVTIERFTSKIKGAIYGSPHKIKDGDLGYANLFLAGTDQGFLGIVGSMLSGVSIVNQHILPKL